MPEPLFRRLALIGVGLIGSSIARIARERGDLAAELVVNARTQRTLDRVNELDLADRTEIDPARAVQGADAVILCAPVGAYAELAAAIGPHLAPGCILTDVGSTKGSVIRDVAPHVPPGVHFIPGHPMAGTEYSGPDSGFTTLFQGRWTLLTPLPGTDARRPRDRQGALAPLRQHDRGHGPRPPRPRRRHRQPPARTCSPSPSAAPPTTWPPRARRRPPAPRS